MESKILWKKIVVAIFALTICISLYFGLESSSIHQSQKTPHMQRTEFSSIWKEKNGLCYSSTSSPPVVYVDDDYNTSTPGWQYDHFDKIQDGIDTVTSGGTIYVHAGVYYENLIINKKINLIGESKETTVVDGNNTEDVVKITTNGVSIEEFSIRNSGYWPFAGVKIYNTENATVHDCNIYSNSGTGIRILASSNNKIYNCTISNNSWGISVELFSSHNTIYNCDIFSNDLYGIELHSSLNNTIHNCNFTNDGILILGDTFSHFIHEIYHNKVNGKSLLYYKNTNNIVINGSEVGEIILINCSNFKIRNIEITNTDCAIEIAYTHDITIYNCLISDNNDGILVWYSSNNTIYKCVIFSNDIGLRLSGPTSVNNEIYNCDILSNNCGLIVSCASDNRIYMNNFANNDDNINYYNDENNIWNSPIPIKYTYHNDTYTNYLGNYWGDYESDDLNDDGIGDIPYCIDTEENIYDYYPLMEPFENYLIQPNDIDGDGLPNAIEEQGWNITVVYPLNDTSITYHVSSDPTKIDTDGDGLSDFEESPYSGGIATDPTKVDTDKDWLTDFEEVKTFFSTPTDWRDDIDNDYFYDYEEILFYWQRGIDNETVRQLIQNPDVDGDGIRDGMDIDPLRDIQIKARIKGLVIKSDMSDSDGIIETRINVSTGEDWCEFPTTPPNYYLLTPNQNESLNVSCILDANDTGLPGNVSFPFMLQVLDLDFDPAEENLEDGIKNYDIVRIYGTYGAYAMNFNIITDCHTYHVNGTDGEIWFEILDWSVPWNETPRVDLTVTSVNAPSLAYPGDYITVSWTVENQGNTASGSFYNRISLSTTPYGTDILLGNFEMDSIPAGSSLSDSRNVQIPIDITPGYYYVTVYADTYEEIEETNEYNNINKAENQIHIIKEDTDGDGLTDWEEENVYNTDPNNPDTDGDRVNDYKEVKEYGTDPNDKDTDDDGIEDNVEIDLAETYKPVLALAQGEIFYPTKVENFLNYSKLMWNVPSPDQEVEGPPVHDYSLQNYYSDNYYLDLVFSDGTDADSLEDYSKIWHEMLMDGKHRNITYVNVSKFKAKVRINYLLPFETYIEGYAIQYWFLYIYNYKFFVHEGDWEHITVFLDKSQKPLAVVYNRHWTTQQCVYWNEVEKLGDHPIIYVAEGSHASYSNSGRDLLEGQYADYHWGNGDWLFGENLNILMIQEQPWIYFKGKWGKYYPVIDIYIGGAPSVLGGSNYFWQPGEELRKSGYVHVFVASPVYLHAVDQYGRHVGVNETGGIEVEIPEAEYSGPDAHPQWIRIYNDSLNVTFYTTGIENGTFNMTFEKKSLFYSEIYNFTDIPTTPSTITYLNSSEPAKLKIDENGDGIIENTSSAPIANFTYYPSIVAVDQLITFNASNSYDPDGDIVAYEWDFGDGKNASGIVAQHNYSDSGIYLVTLKVTDNQNLSSTMTVSLYVVYTKPPFVNFTYEPENPTTKDIVYFYDLSADEDGTVTEWYWEFGDGTTSILQNPTHIYGEAGTYIVNLTVWDDMGASNITSKVITVIAPPNNPPNIPNKPSGPSFGYTGTSYSYSTSTTDPDEDKIRYYFDWGDGIKEWTAFVDSGKTIAKSHIWSDPGVYTIKVKAQDENGAESDWSEVKTVTITVYTPPPPNQLPTCSLSASPSLGYVPLNVSFTMNANDIDGNIISWTLDINNDDIAEYSGIGNPPQMQHHIYQNIGNYTARLTVVDNNGASATDTVLITVIEKPNQPPIAKFDYTPKSPIKVGETMSFIDNSTDLDGEIVNWTWSLGNGVILYGNKINYTYNQSGIYNVTLTVRDNDGAVDDYTMTVTIKKEKKGIPGFELLLFIVAIIIPLLWKRE